MSCKLEIDKPLIFDEICADKTQSKPFTFTNGDSVPQDITLTPSSHFVPNPSTFHLNPKGSQGDSKTVNIEFNPNNFVGTLKELIDVASSGVRCFSILFIGPSKALTPLITISTGSIHFGDVYGFVCVGDSQEKSFKITNTGCREVIVTITANQPLSVSPSQFSLNPSQTQIIKVIFAPMKEGYFSGVINISDGFRQYGVSVDGTGTAFTRLTPNKSLLDFGEFCVNIFKDLSFEISNDRCGATITDAYITNNRIDNVPSRTRRFDIITNNLIGTTIYASDPPMPITVRFKPQAAGIYDADLTINYEGPDRIFRGSTGLSLRGKGNASPLLFSMRRIYDFGTVELNVPVVKFPEFTFNIKNIGCVPANITVSPLNPPFIPVISLPSTINPGQTKPLIIRFEPSAEGTYNSTITINYGGANRLVLSLFGEAVSVDIDVNCYSLQAQLADLQAELNGTGPYSRGGLTRRQKSVVMRDIRNVIARMGYLGCPEA